jgi:DNA-binding beta-propeller fold protein YncE
VSPDGKHVYVSTVLSNAVAAFARNKVTGALPQLPGTAGCISEDGTGGLCVNGAALGRPQSIAVSKDGHNVYVASFDSNAVVTLVRDPKSGQLFELEGQSGCVSDDGSGGICADGRALVQASAIAVSSDGKNVYVASTQSDAVAIFARAK